MHNDPEPAGEISATQQKHAKCGQGEPRMNKAFLLEIAHLNPRIKHCYIAEFTPRLAPKMPAAVDCVVLSNIKECKTD